jgi:acetyl-CoA C-acetyltransferase
MATGIRDKVAILGMGCCRFGERWESSAEDLMVEAFTEALQDAGIEKKEIGAAWLGTHIDEINVGKGAIPLANTLKLPYKAVTRVENYCATATEAFRGACYAVASGAYDICLALGVEKLKDTGYGGLPGGAAFGQFSALVAPNATAPGLFAQLATSYFAKYEVDPALGKRALAHISAKSHANGAMNPKAHLRRVVTEEEIIKAPMIAYPLGLFDCCGVSDGAAAGIVTTPEIARALGKKDPVLVKALAIAVSSGEEAIYTNWDGAHLETTYRAGQMAFQEADIRNPRKEISMMEVHDCFSITELTVYEDLLISPRGGAIKDILDGFYDLKGGVPCQVDGGLKCFGHPIGASGLRMLYEMYNQLLERYPEERRVKSPKMGLTHNLGGTPSNNVCSVAIIGR